MQSKAFKISENIKKENETKSENDENMWQNIQ